MIDGTRCYAAMTSVEQTRWRKETGGGDYSKFLMDRKYENFEEFIKASFIWDRTKHGMDYWEYISKKYILHDMLSPKMSFKGSNVRKPLT